MRSRWPARPASSSGQEGFTLIELLVCLTILTLMTAFLSSHWPRRGAALKDAADDLADTLRETRERAIADGRPESLLIDPKGNRYSDWRGQTRTLPSGVHLSLLTERPLGDAADSIVFFPDGGATGEAIGLSDGGNRLEIRVDWLTGRVVAGNR